ncbi:SDR family oxidoreductase [Paraferrimonas sp. SM1919]|uniref:SDR family NAD(P)-dependent oxidoreductase n=1 Tax=Paraferrimonas sp. SM1919 TaxID=2662263 RepID=UPI0013D25524|nr:SDR family NAD(P)-dependent oxidoreductase [Paraferrimonas sp. SM1919]
MRIDGTNKLAVITGGSSGIGLAIADTLAQHNWHLLLVARNPDKLAEAYRRLSNKTQVTTLSVDLTSPDSPKRLKDAINQHKPCADLIINNAGIVSAGLFDEIPLDEWQRLYHLNITALVANLQPQLSAMKQQYKIDNQPRHIVNIASAAGLLPFMGMSAYSSTKAALIAISECLRTELDYFNIGVSVICPDFVKTPIAAKVKLFGSMDNPKVTNSIQKMFIKQGLPATLVASKTLTAIQQNKSVVVVGQQVNFAYWLKRINPYWLYKLISRKFSK